MLRIPTMPTRFVGVFLLLVSVGSSLPSSVEAQATRADSAAVLLNAARAFQSEGRWEVAEALFHYIGERYGDTGAGAQALAALQEAPGEGPGRNSQVELMVWATTYGAWLGVAIPGALGADDPGPYGAGLLLGGPAGFLGGRALARSRPLSEGQVRAITFGSAWGTWQGYGLMEVLDWGEEERCDLDLCYTSGRDGADIFKAFVVGGLAGTVTGAILSRKPIPSGVATAVNFGALWGSWFGLAGGVLADLEGDGLLTSTLLAGDAGLLATATMAPGWNMSQNRARLISIAGVLGGLAGAGLDLLIQPDDEKVAMGIPLAGSIVGLVVGAKSTSGRNPRVGSVSGDIGGDDEFQGVGSSLLRFQEGRFSFGVPAPFPTMMPVEGVRGVTFKPALGITLLDSRF
ncbi:MAG: hypothetical protein ABIF09_06920 [Gemmatimonadota bacterium]